MVKDQLKRDLKSTLTSLGFEVDDVVLSISPKAEFGDYSTNVALQLAKQNSENSKQNPTDIANQISENLGKLEYLEKVEVKGAGFINLFLKDQALIENLTADDLLKTEDLPKQKILVEYGHVNLLKEVHIGHLRTFILGEALSTIIASLGNEVFRANYQGDIGPHIAKAIWGIKKLGLPSENITPREKGQFLGQAYAEGNSAYEANPNLKSEIDQINKQLYLKDPAVMESYNLARQWSLDYLEPIYQLLGTRYDHCFFESEVAEEGKEIVLANVSLVFEKSDGAIIFPGEKHGLHNRVFITSEGNPTYEGKEVGLAKAEFETFAYDLAIHVVASEQNAYFEVVFKALEMIFPHLKGKKHHLSYGFVNLKSGKMSSRTGQIISFDELFSAVSEKVRQLTKEEDQVKKISIGAIKFAYLKFSPSAEMTFDLEASISLQGDSGPYVQYTNARANSVLSGQDADKNQLSQKDLILTGEERAVLLLLEEFQAVVTEAAKALRPNLICEYLLNLSHSFNLFYQKSRILNSDSKSFRLKLTGSVAETLKLGLKILGIEAPERM